jgi:glycosyltransferase involved in cell wall biosynthesis/SAM-dependent methyltransferase
MNVDASFANSRCNSCGGQTFTVMARRTDKVAVLRCEGCGLGVAEAIPTDLTAVYADAHYASQKVGAPVRYDDYQRLPEHCLSWAAELVCRLKDGGKILDVDCADGNLLKRLPSTFDLYGIEADEYLVARAEEANINILGRNLLDASNLENYTHRFDCVTAIAVFEHLRDFRGGIQAALSLLKHDGFLLFEVPYISETHENRIWFESSLEQVFYPSRDSMRRLIESLGFTLVGGEVHIRGFASTFIGVAFNDAALADYVKELFTRITGTEGHVSDKKLRAARQKLMLIHAAQSTPDLLEGLPDLSPSHLDAPPLLDRIEKLWTADLQRLATSRSDYDAIEARLISLTTHFDESYAYLSRVKQLEVANLQVEVENLRADIMALNAKLDLFHSSIIWRSTSILRRVAKRFPRVAHAARRVLKLLKWCATFQLRQRLSEVIAHRRKLREEKFAESQVQLPQLVFDERTGLDGYVPASAGDAEEWPKDRPLVSVIVVSFNYGRFVEEAVDSVLAQTFLDIEVIVVEGGSTDPESREHTLALKRPRTRVVAQMEAHQVGANRNFGIREARGKYICCLDADDMLKPTYIEKAVFLLETYGYDVVSCAMQQFGGSDEKVGVLEKPVLADMLQANHVLTCAVFRKSLWARAGGYRDTNRAITGYVYEDWLFWAQLATMGARIRNISKDHLFLYRRHGSSLTTKPDLHAMVIHRKLIRQALADLITPDALRKPRLTEEDRRTSNPLINFLGRCPNKGTPAILLALPWTAIGGAERLLSGIVTHLVKEGWRVTIVTSIEPGDEVGDSTRWFEPATAEIFKLPRFLPANQWPDFVDYLIASREINVVWIAGSAFMYDLLPKICGKFPKIRVVDSLFNTVGHTENNRKYAKLIDLNFVENNEVLQFLLDAGVSRDRVLKIASGIDLQEFLPRPRDASVVDLLGAAPEDLIVGFSGRWSEEKDPLAFVEIARKSSHLPIHFVMTGAGVLRSKIENELAKAKLGNRFHLIGEVQDVRPWLASYDVLVLPSRLDGRPVVVLEALALGVPVIASAVGGLPELIHNGKNGYLCQPRMISEFVDRLAKLALDRELLKRMKEASRHGAEQSLDIRNMLSCYENGLSALVRTERRRERHVSFIN